MSYVQQTKGAVSNREMQLFAQAETGLSKSKEGNMLMLKIAKRALERDKKYMAHFGKWKKENPDLGYSDWLVEEAEWEEKNPIKFSDEELKIINDSIQAEKNIPDVEVATERVNKFLQKDRSKEEIDYMRKQWEKNYPNSPFPG